MMEFKAKNLAGEERTYKLRVMDCETGLKLWHQYFSEILPAIPEMSKALGADGDDLTIDTLQLGMTITQSLPWELVKEFAGSMLSKAEIVIGDTTHILDDSGFGSCFKGDPVEFFTAVYHAAMANYEPLIAQFRTVEKKKEQSPD